MRILLALFHHRHRHWVTYGIIGPAIALILFGLPGLLGAIASFAVYDLLSAPSAGERNRIERYLGGVSVSVRFTVGRLHVHLHHWLTMLVLLITLTVAEDWLIHTCRIRRDVLAVLYGACIGGTAQGLRYSDRFYVVRRRQLSIALSRRGSEVSLVGGVATIHDSEFSDLEVEIDETLGADDPSVLEIEIFTSDDESQYESDSECAGSTRKATNVDADECWTGHHLVGS